MEIPHAGDEARGFLFDLQPCLIAVFSTSPPDRACFGSIGCPFSEGECFGQLGLIRPSAVADGFQFVSFAEVSVLSPSSGRVVLPPPSLFPTETPDRFAF